MSMSWSGRITITWVAAGRGRWGGTAMRFITGRATMPRGRRRWWARNSHEIHRGGDDNAWGTTAMLEWAARFARDARNGKPLPRSIMFVAFTGEEEGLIGSQKFVKEPPVPLSQIDAMLNLDM